MSLGLVLWDFLVKAGLLKPKSVGFGNLLGVSYLRGTKRKSLGGGGDCLSQGLLWESYKKFTFACDSVHSYLGCVLAREG